LTELNDDETELLKKNGLPVKKRYTVKELSDSLDISPKTIFGWSYYGRYEGLKIGGARFFSIQTVINILQDSTTL
jgi:hypothetical protein